MFGSAVFRTERWAGDFLAHRVSNVAIFPRQGMRDAKSEAALAAAFEKGRVQEVTPLYQPNDAQRRLLVTYTDWCLAYR